MVVKIPETATGMVAVRDYGEERTRNYCLMDIVSVFQVEMYFKEYA